MLGTGARAPLCRQIAKLTVRARERAARWRPLPASDCRGESWMPSISTQVPGSATARDVLCGARFMTLSAPISRVASFEAYRAGSDAGGGVTSPGSRDRAHEAEIR